ncbi:hypothetical protein HMPREF9505_01614 [Enterococcus faecalis TX0109]|nr:hypothetical protein HMPREF9505_01614 [Enterococcus faecalis TX0109]
MGGKGVFTIEETYLHSIAERSVGRSKKQGCLEKREYQSLSVVIAKIHLEVFDCLTSDDCGRWHK